MTKCKVFIVDDEYIIAVNLKQELESAGYDVCGMASEGNEAIKKVKETDPAIVIIDINLVGELDGIEVAHLIKKFSSPHIIFTTGYQNPSLKKRAKALNPAAYLIKPVSMNEINKVFTSICPRTDSE